MAAMLPAARGSLPVAAAREKPENPSLHSFRFQVPPSVTEQVIIQLRRPPTRPQTAPYMKIFKVFHLRDILMEPAIIPVEDADAQVTARVRGTQPELTGMTKSLKMATRSRSKVLATAVRGQTMGTERMVVPTIAQSENLRSSA